MAGYNNSANYQVSQYNLITGGTNNLPNNVAPGVSGTLLTSNGVSSESSYQSFSSETFPWSVVSGTSQTCVINNGYIASNAAQVNMYLPSTAAFGSEEKFTNINAGFNVVPAPGQTVRFLAQSATYPSYFQTTVANAALDIICTNANTSWNVVNNEGTFTNGVITSALSACFTGNDLLYLKAGGQSWGTGFNGSGELGNDTRTVYSSPISTVGGNSYIQIYSAQNATLALRIDGSCWSWGNNTSGQLGNNSTTSYSSPISVVGAFSFIKIQISGQTVTQLGMSAGLLATGAVWMWGVNNYGNLGNDTLTNYSSPISVVGNHSFVQISLGALSSYGLKADGSCWAWGAGANGAVGNNTTNSYSSPISVIGAHSFIQISAGNQCACGLKIDGSCWSWGYNSEGQLGTQNGTSYSSPVSVVGAHSFIQLQSGGTGSCYGLKANGQIWCWGNNSSGQLAQQNTTNYSSPVSVVGGFSFVNLAANGIDNETSSMGAWISNGQLWAWGYNFGVLGNNSTTNTSSPVLVLNTP